VSRAVPNFEKRLIRGDRGGNDPAVVLDDVDIEDVAPKVSHGTRIRFPDANKTPRLLVWRFSIQGR
jgi:hypothetical protein